MTECVLSVAMPNYNHGRYLAEAVLGIATQSRPPDEFIVLDDASTDDSVEILRPFLERFPFMRLIRLDRNQGVLAAIERLSAEARGRYLFLPAADDVRMPGFFERAMALAEEYPQAALVCGGVSLIDEAGRHLGYFGVQKWNEPLYADPRRFLEEYLMVESPSHSLSAATIYRRDAFLELGGLRPELGSWSDSFVIRALGLKYGICYVPMEAVRVRMLPQSFSHQTMSEPKKLLDIIARAERLMLSDEFRDIFPPAYARHWARSYRYRTVRDFFLGPEPSSGPRPSFFLRNLRRLPKLLPALRLWFYRGQLVTPGERR
jgi:glycosyltransferase involved in cell wall biosynthesis